MADDYGIFNPMFPTGTGAAQQPAPALPQQNNLLAGILALLFPALAAQQSSPQAVPSSALPQPTPAPAPQPQQYATNPWGQSYAVQPWMQQSGRAEKPLVDPIADVAGMMAGSAVAPAGRAILSSEVGGIGGKAPKVGPRTESLYRWILRSHEKMDPRYPVQWTSYENDLMNSIALHKEHVERRIGWDGKILSDAQVEKSRKALRAAEQELKRFQGWLRSQQAVTTK